MILADKIIQLRKQNGWSQEELAEMLNVSRQSVSKWEGAQSVPDLQKILMMAELFGVTTDYLLKDDMESEEYVETTETDSSMRKVSLVEANEFIELQKTVSKRIAFGVLLCIISPICLILLSVFSELQILNMSENLAVALGVSVLLLIIAGAVAIFVSSGFKNAPYEYLEKEKIETEYGVTGMVKEKQKAFKSTYVKSNIIGVCLCVISAVPLLATSFIENDAVSAAMVCVLLLLVAIAVFLFVTVGVRWGSMQKLLQEGEYTDKKKKENRLKEKIGGVYWPIIVAVYLAWSFISGDWHYTWIIWPVAGVAFAVVENVYLLIKKE